MKHWKGCEMKWCIFGFCTSILLEAVSISGTYLVWIQSALFWNMNWTYDCLTILIPVAFTNYILLLGSLVVESSWNVMAHSDAWEGKWRENWWMEWVVSTLEHTTSEHGVSNITTVDAHTSAASSWLNWCPCRFQWTCLFCEKTKSGFCVCAITFQTQSTVRNVM